MNIHDKAIITNAMTVDVEDYFQVSAFERVIPKDQWDSIPCRIENNMDKILSLFSDYNVKATFFTLGWIAQRYPSLIKRIVNEGHELASHGWEHTRVIHQDSKTFRNDIKNTKSLLEDISGQAVRGYRAASYSINASNIWALDDLADMGYEYSSSVVPIHHDLYGMPDASRFHFRTKTRNFLEIPITTVPIAGKNLNCGGGGWFRLYPYAFTKWALKRVNNNEKEPCVFYFHPWEIDVDQPKIEGISAKTKFRHYVNLNRTFPRVEKLLSDFQWSRMDRIFLDSKKSIGTESEMELCH